ncbi:hypothetical protein LSAT2_024124 [Lamellibrachia satsuma]|nr:hypothetical protein LSAT2_024124 [Lamellibrachia satsuma]
MKIVALSIVFAVCIALTDANGRGMYMGMYRLVGGRRCANDCSYLPPGNHPSCLGCDIYVTCFNGNMFPDRKCAAGLEWDNDLKTCNWPAHSTCHKNI